MKEDRKKEQYSKNVKNLGFVSFFTDVSTEMILGILPVFIITDLGASKAILGLIEGLGEFIGYGSRTFSGALSDRIGKRKSFVFVGYALSTVSKPLFALSTVWPHALGVRVTDRIGKGVRSAPRDALLSDSVPANQVGRAFGLHRSLDQAGAIVGPVIAFSLMPLFGIRGIFWLSFIPGIIALMILLFYVREKRIIPRKTSVITNFREVLHGKFLLFMIMVIIFSLGAFNFSFILLESIELGLIAAMVPLVYAIINVTHTAVGYPAGRFSDKIGGEKVLTIGFALFFLTSLIGFMEPNQIYIVFVMGAIFGLYFGIAETTQRAIIPKYVKKEICGTAFGVYYLIIGISFLVANSVVGTLWDNFGAGTAFSYSMIMSALGIIGMIVFSYLKHQ